MQLIDISVLSLDQFNGFISNHEFYCFGAGNMGKRWALIFIDKGVGSHCKGFFENDISKVGRVLNVENYEYTVYSVKEILKNNNINIIITCMHSEDIIKQLEIIKTDCSIRLISLERVADKQLQYSSYKCVMKEKENPIIPKKIHYAWFGGKMPDNLKRNIDGWHKICPEYEIVEWNDSNYDVTKNEYMMEAYDSQIFGFVPDYLRLDVVYQYGGIYLDTDIEIVKNVDDLLYQKCFGCCDSSFVLNLGSGFGAIKGCTIIRELRDYYESVHFNTDGILDKTPCNTHSYKVLRKYKYAVNDRYQKIKEMNIYPMIFQGCNLYSHLVRITENTFFIHHGNNSWL